MIQTAIFPGRYVQGNGSLQGLGDEMARFGKRAFVLLDPFVEEQMLDSIQTGTRGTVEADFRTFGGECSDEEIAKWVEAVQETGADVVVGVGGGKTLDTAKAVSHGAGRPVVVVPTIASTDAPCSALSVIYTADGAFKRYLFLPRNPDAVVVDTSIAAQAPTRFLVSGMGDALATYFEAESCRWGRRPNMTGNYGNLAAFSLARLCYDILLEYGVQAKNACDQGIVTPALEKIVEANTLLSGIGFESGGLASAHAIHNGLTALDATHAFFHGEKVAVGVLAGLFLTDKPPLVIDEVYTFCESVGLPTTLADIGLADVGDAQLTAVADAACAEGETIHNELVPVSSAAVVTALKAFDAWGCHRKRH